MYESTRDYISKYYICVIYILNKTNFRSKDELSATGNLITM